ncbi:MAG TPA: FAD-binding oxidoreductase [Chthoniobacterales bacterium]|nr:FAD-binding oxidoreductase [Chthoniobacterales bacterium]
METQSGVEASNWFGDITFRPSVVVRPTSEQELVAIVKDSARYPTPVRAAGSSHSTTRCVVSEPGTKVDMRGMNRILQIGRDTVVAQAGALYIDVAKELQKHGLQFYVNIELGNLSMGAAACTHTKDAAFAGEYGIVCSYAIGFKAVLPSGDILVVTEEQPELLQAMRTSFGLLGLIFEVTFRVKPLKAMAFHHENFTVDEFERQLPALRARGESIMYYLFPFQDRIAVEFRKYVDEAQPATSLAWKIRNFAWGTMVPGLGAAIRTFVPARMRYALYEGLGTVSRVLLNVIRDGHSYPADQMIRYPEKPGFAKYTFSIWAFPEENFPQSLRRYYAFCREHYRTHGYRCDMLNVGYRIFQDQSSLFSYPFHGTVMTLDPVSTAGPGWFEFLDAYNEFCSENGAFPLFNQTGRITAAQVAKSYGDRLEAFRALQRQSDPENRFVNSFFAEILGLASAAPAATP